MKKILIVVCAVTCFAACKSDHDKMVEKIEANEKALMADTLMKDDSLVSRQYVALTEFTTKFPKDEKTLTYLIKSADLANRMRMTTQAFMLYKKINDEYPDTKQGADAMFMMAFLYENNFKNIEKAKEYYTAFINKYPDHPFVNDAQASLDMLNSGKTIEDMIKEWEAKADTSTATAVR